MERSDRKKEYSFRYRDVRGRSYEMLVLAENEEEARNEFRTKMYNVKGYTVKETGRCAK